MSTNILLFIIVLLIIIILFINSSLSKAKENSKVFKIRLADSENRIDNLLVKLSNNENRIKDLSKYQDIIDTEEKCKELLLTATIESLKKYKIGDEHYKRILDEENIIKQEAKDELKEARVKSKNIIDQANDKLESSIKEALNIILNAETKAREIAGSAYDAMKDAEYYERTAKAMKNVVKGYGDEYLKPTFSLLDDLSEEFSHTDAGKNLKIARDRNIAMINSKSAAKCDYVEAYRKETAINFVLDAFNGKVDSILSKVSKDNYGILQQKIKDAFQMVNNNGRAFKNAEINTEYLNSRLDELNWAVITQELKWKEREEQRLIKEQIREEEKAQREYEQAKKEAEKEEKLLKKLIEQAQKEVEKSSEQEREKYLTQKLELEEKLRVAEEKNQRAISMAQQTKAGNVYIISNIGSFGEDVFKIGMTRRLEPLERVKELGDASVPFEFDVHAMIYSDNAPKLEKELHRKFLRLQLNKVNPRKEFFKVGIVDIKHAVENLGISTKWTITSEAKQFRESLALAEAIKKDKKLEAEWELSQNNDQPK